MKKIIRSLHTPEEEDYFVVNLRSRLEERPEGDCLYIWVHNSYFHKKGVQGSGYTTLYDSDPNAKTFRYGPVNGSVWLRMHRYGIEQDASWEYVQIFKAYTGRVPVIHMKRV